jgi:hypothetical protein
LDGIPSQVDAAHGVAMQPKPALDVGHIALE